MCWKVKSHFIAGRGNPSWTSSTPARDSSLLCMKILTVKGAEILLDDDDYERLKGIKWHFDSKRKQTRCRRRTRIGIIKFRIAWLIIGVPPIGLYTDHIDRNPLNNQRSNLRFCTPLENSRNRGSCNKNGSKGITFRPNRINPWRARIMVFGKHISLGCFMTKEKAGAAYVEAAKRYFGAFAAF